MLEAGDCLPSHALISKREFAVDVKHFEGGHQSLGTELQVDPEQLGVP